MAVLPYLIMSSAQAANFREETMNDEYKLEPRLIEAGPYTGKYALPERVLFDDNYENRRDAFRMLQKVTIDRDEAWPPTQDDLRVRFKED